MLLLPSPTQCWKSRCVWTMLAFLGPWVSSEIHGFDFCHCYIPSYTVWQSFFWALGRILYLSNSINSVFIKVNLLLFPCPAHLLKCILTNALSLSHPIHFSEHLPGLFTLIQKIYPVAAPCNDCFPDKSCSPVLIFPPVAPHFGALDLIEHIYLRVCECPHAFWHICESKW